MKTLSATVVAASLALAGAVFAADPEDPIAAQKPGSPSPRVEVVFALDTTGSMSGLIEGAKQKIWAIANEIASGKPTPEIRIGLVPYRDRGDDYVTRVVELSDDLDAVYAELMKFRADGGGDRPESVNQALHDAVHRIQWSNDPDVLRILFLVGDCPPHMDYEDDTKYQESCRVAVKHDIIINTVQCGGHADTTHIWQKIADLSEGRFAQIAQGGGMEVVATPFDDELAGLGRDMASTRFAYGTGRDRTRREGAVKLSAEVAASAAPAAAADRVLFYSKGGSSAADESDLVAGYRRGDVALAEMKAEELPAQIRDMSDEDREEWVREQSERQVEIQAQIDGLNEKRQEWLVENRPEPTAERDGFDKQVLGMLQTQAAAKGIEYETAEPKTEPEPEKEDDR